MNYRDQKIAVAVVYVAAMFMAIMDPPIVNVALPTLGRDFHASTASVGTVSIAYLVSLAVFIPVSGWLGDRIGGRGGLLGGVAGFTIGSAVCGVSTSLGELVAFRVLQGAGGAVMTPVGLALLFRLYPPAERVRIASILALATALGPILGGLLTTDLTWRWVFFVNVPIGAATFLYGSLALADHSQAHPGRLDVGGLILSGLGLGSGMCGVSEGPAEGWSSTPVLATIVIGAVLLGTLVVVELRTARPLVDLRLFRQHRLFTVATALYGLGSVSYLGALYLAALFFQDALHLSALQSGLVTFPSALGVMAGGQLVTRVLYRRFGPRRIVSAGLVVMAAALVLMAQVSPGTSLWLVRLIMFGLGAGVACVFIPAQAASMATVSKAQTGQASPLFNAGKQLGGAIGVAPLASVLAAAGPSGAAAGPVVVNLTAFHAGFLAAAAVAGASVAVALGIRDADAAATMAPGRARDAASGPDNRSRSSAVSG